MENYLNKILGGRYEIQEIIGVGGMSVVYKAYDRQDGRIAAVKILKDEYLANEEFRRRFKNESKAIAVLSHPNIVKVYDVNFGDKLQYIVMEHVEGITLKEYIERQKNVDWKEALHFVIQILRALQHAHDKGIIHRDIKPQNILLLQNGNIKVTDFGIARFNRGEMRSDAENTAIGSVHYVSPEQARGEYTDERSDIYSVGVVLYEMITGQLPFEAENASDIVMMQMQKDPRKPTLLNTAIPVGLEQITMRAMQKNPKDRYQSAAEFLLDLDEFKRNPLVKFDYSYFIDNTPTKYLNVSTDPLPTPAVSRLDENVSVVPRGKPANRGSVVPPAVNKNVDAPYTEEYEEDYEDEDEDMLDEEDEYEYRGRNLTVPLLTGITIAVVAVVGIVMLTVFFDPISSYFEDQDNFIGRVFTKISDVFGDEEIEVPNFLNRTYEEIVESYPELFFEEPVYELNTEYEPGHVCAQTPPAGTTMAKSTVVKLTIARSATSQIAVPDVIGKNYVTAQNELKAYGFTVVPMPVYVEGETVGNVISTDPVAGTMLETLKKVTIYYASAVNTAVVDVPNVVNQLLADAKAAITKAGLAVGDVSYEASAANLKGYVISQTPAAGSEYRVEKGSAVNLVVGSGVAASSTVSFYITLPNTGAVGTITVYVANALYETYDNVNFDGGNYQITIKGTGASNYFKIMADDATIYTGYVNFTTVPGTISDMQNYQTEEKKSVPNVVGMTEASARAALREAGFENITVQTTDSDKAAGTVVEQAPGYSTLIQYALSTTITLQVSNGSQPTTVDGEEITEPEPPTSVRPDPPTTPPTPTEPEPTEPEPTTDDTIITL